MSKRSVDVREVKDLVKELFIKANTVLREDVLEAIKALRDEETLPEAKKMLGVLVDNADVAGEKSLPICQDTGLSVVFIELGQDVQLEGGDLTVAINKGVAEAYEEGLLRKSVVEDPILRNNTGTNAPASIHIDIVPGDKFSISVLPKGFGSENKGKIGMLNPTAGEDAIVDFCVDAVRSAGPDACPPYAIGVGIGGTMDTSAMLAKKALLRPVSSKNIKEHLASLEKNILKKAKDLNIGIMGLGGISTAMSVNVEAAPTHIAGLPVAVNLSCHALRSASGEI